VFWIGGPSGTGKSVLLLQVVRELILRGNADAVQFLAEFAHRLPEALEVSSRTSRRLVLAVDDLFALGNRDPGLWRQIAEAASLRIWNSLPLILTCGPPEQLKAFERECRRHSGLQLASISLTPLGEGEQLQYNTWYRERTDHDVALRSEPIFVAATWAYELSRRARLSPEAFSQRFDDRLQELGLQAAARAALALNGYGLAASPALFAGYEDALEQLKSEKIYRLGQQGTGSRSGFFFHPRIAKILYDVLVSQTAVRERALDLARGFRAMLTIPEVGSSFLEWLTGARAESLLQPTLQKEVLVALWSVFNEAGPLESVIPVTFRWHRLARDRGLDLAALGAPERIRTWWTNTAEDSPPWGLLFQMVWSDGSVEERNKVFAIGFSWLNTQPDQGSWNYVWQLLWAHERERSDLALLGLLWLLDHAGKPGWGYVWQLLYDSGFREPELIGTGLQGIATGPETSADFHLWQKVASIADRTALCDALVRNLARRLFRKTGIKLLFDLAKGESVVTLAATAFHQTQEETCWALLWQELQATTPNEPALLALGETWLQSREDRPEWNYIWQALLAQGYHRDEFLQRGLNWLDQREDRPDWNYIWQALLAQGYHRDELLQRGLNWLDQREDRPDWSHIWQALLAQDYHRDELLYRGLKWLDQREDRPDWSHIWQALLAQDYHRDELLHRGLKWLDQREDRPEWSHNWEVLVAQGHHTAELLQRGFKWLDQREDRPEWNYLWQALLAEDYQRDELLQRGFKWLDQREDRPDWNYIWRALLAEGYQRDELLQRGLKWLDQREDRPDWSHIWRVLLAEDYQRDELLQRGFKWLDQREDRPDWSHIWQALLAEDYRRDELLQRGFKWLDQREDRPEWSYVWEKLFEYDRAQRGQLHHLATQWLRANPDHPRLRTIRQGIAFLD
jgi:hypothetical protein